MTKKKQTPKSKNAVLENEVAAAAGWEPSTAPAMPAGKGMSEEAALAYASMKDEIASLDASDLVPINLDMGKTCTSVLGTLANLEPYHAPLARLEGLDAAKVRSLRRYGLGALYADILATPEDDVAPLVEEATQLKQSLLAGADALAARGLLDSARIAEVRSGLSYVELGKGCVALAGMFQEQWDVVEHRTAVPREEVDRAGVVGTELLFALGARAQGVKRESSMAIRQRAFSILIHAYDEARRGITFLRWKQGDVDDIVPSLYVKRRSGSSQTDASGDAAGTSTANGASTDPTHTNGAPAAASTGIAAHPAASAPTAGTPPPSPIADAGHVSNGVSSTPAGTGAVSTAGVANGA